MNVLSHAESNTFINAPITGDEILQCIKSLKRNKSAGCDHIINEYIKSTSDFMLPLYVRLFNSILDSGNFPSSWLCGEIIPIYKNKGNESEASNYRPITLLSCLSKLFTSIINERLNAYADEVELILSNQAGFRKNFCTLDHIFSLYSLQYLFKGTKRNLFCAFIDFQKAFDSVWRIGLWNKILMSNIDGKCFRVINDMYKGIKAKIRLNDILSDEFPCQLGVRQGENLSPFLFLIYLNDLEQFMLTEGASGLPFVEERLENEIQIYVKLLLLLYADDTIILSQSEKDLQNKLNIFHDYCTKWRLNVNVDKTKIMIFGKRNTSCYRFVYDNNEIEIVDEFKYLGIFFKGNGSFSNNIKYQYDKATRSMFDVLQKCKRNNLSIKCQLDLFDRILQPILLHGCEIWGFSNTTLIEKLHLRFCKYILKLNQNTPNYFIYGELGRFPLLINIKIRMINFWSRIVTSDNSKLTKILYSLVCKDNRNPWVKCVRNILNECGLSYIFENNDFLNRKWLKAKVSQTLKDQNLQKWSDLLCNSSKAINYCIIKNDLSFEFYLDELPKCKRELLCRFRASNFKLPVETGRWNNVPRNERICTLCNCNALADEFHYLFNCTDEFIKKSRIENLDEYYRLRPDNFKFHKLFNSKNIIVLKRLCKFLLVIRERACPPS